ncbi:hypothetical protein [Nocardia sp. XZ_19_385]|nr:hypothetical protein [Nocardia sp. XZ_19_385]
MPAVADRWRTVAPDFPGFGYSAASPDFSYTFDGGHWLLETHLAEVTALM